MTKGKALAPLSLVLLLASAVFGLPGPAFAHARLIVETPSANGAVEVFERIVLKFSEGLEIAFAKVKVTGPGGKVVATGGPSLDPNDNSSLIVPIAERLAGGEYKVDWRAVSADGHSTQGTYSFTYKP